MKHARVSQGLPFAKKLAVFFAVSFVWFAIDRVTKLWANTVEPGSVLVENIAQLFDFRLVHNTGAAWGIFAGSTTLLGLFSIAVCVVILVFVFTYFRTQGSTAQMVFLALVFAGGLGNAVDRLLYDYVVDFIQTRFIDFPVFNVADIGVTIGIVLLMLSIFIHDWRKPQSRST